jgi:hypothetical protein
MPILNPNSTNYTHSWEPNLADLHVAMGYTETGEPALRVLSNIQGDINIEGELVIPGTVKVENVEGTTLAINDGGNSITVDGTVSVDNFPNIANTKVEYIDSANLSAFSRLRTANTRLLGEFRNQYGTMGAVEIVTRFENNGSQTVNLAQAHTLINVTNENGSRALRQSRKYHPYIPGTTNLAYISFTLAASKSNLQQMVGLFDDSNGIFFRRNGTISEMVIRKGGVDTQVVAQSSWNVDRLDGTGPSGIDINFGNSLIFVLDYQWLGVGRVRVGFNVGGRIYYVHYFSHVNALSEPYMYQPSLPARWEIRNTGVTDSSSSLMCICYGVYVEGAEVDTGFDNSISNGAGSVTLGASPNNVKGILAVRLRNTVNGQPNRAYALLKDWEVITSLTAQYRVMILQGSSAIAGTPTWLLASPTGWCEYITDFALSTPFIPADTVILFDGYATGNSNRGTSTFRTTDNRSSTIYQNYDSTDSMIFAIFGYRIPNDNAVMRASMNWVEIK